MTRPSANSIINSLKGKIWLATTALAFFICTFGLISYLLVSFVFNDTFYAVFTPFLFVGFVVMIFGWWLSNEVVSPIEKVTLLAKSLERGILSSLPRTSGSVETDELLQTLNRSNQQMQTVIGLMDKAAGGNLDIALAPLQANDRLSNSFQKLLGKVSESIRAGQNLEKLQAAVLEISEEIAPVRLGNLNIEIKSDFAELDEISESFRYLLRQLNDLKQQVKNESLKTEIAAAEIHKTFSEIVRNGDARMQNLNRAKLALERLPGSVRKMSEDLSQSAVSANHSIETAGKGMRTAQQNLSAVAALREQIREAVKRVRQINERSQEINKVSKAITDLANRTNLIALNASIQTAEANNSGFAVIAEEIQNLADRAGNTNKYVSSLHKTLLAETVQIERLLEESFGEMANVSKLVIETGNSLGEIERSAAQSLNSQEQIASFARENTEESEAALQAFINSISETENTIERLKQSEANFAQLLSATANLQTVAGNCIQPSGKETVPLNDFYEYAESAEQEFIIEAEEISSFGV